MKVPRMARIPLTSEFKTQKEAVVGGAYFLLPAEVDALTAKIVLLTGRQNELGAMMGEAMNESSETFHDNAPAEAISHESRLIVSEYSSIAKVLRSAERIDYPQDTSKVEIGSVTEIQYKDETDSGHVLITGYTGKIDASSLVEGDAQCVAALTPLGQALLEAEAGQEVSYTAGNREFRIGVIAVKTVLDQNVPTI